MSEVAGGPVDQAQAAGRRFRGKNKAPAWRRPVDGPVTVVRLRLTPDPATRPRLERLFGAAWSLKRALRRDARSRALAYRAGHRRRTPRAAKRWRVRLGLSRDALERAGYRHLDASGHLKHHLSKAVAMHIADEVWTGLERHLFADASGRRHGVPKVGSWWEFSRIPGRARSHTKGEQVGDVPVARHPGRAPGRPPRARPARRRHTRAGGGVAAGDQCAGPAPHDAGPYGAAQPGPGAGGVVGA
ncbi:hypothetical protein [Actinomadura sp. 7K507]|uniref:hypothetical protein n=1 Tax=Actinomadura sp. 7K507 TaxID=2530365 RepID=UPI0010524E7B|nr:hypothetical protein [Actinomadura sp. 7K507]TDC92704.1 hypothetical protein E1285_11135 [Actinomadura sp. 7K507]